MPTNTTPTFEAYAIVELFGHQQIAGRLTEKTIGGATFLQVDVPETSVHPPYSRLFNPSAVYAINPTDEETARLAAEHLKEKPPISWSAVEAIRKGVASQLNRIGGGELSAGRGDWETDNDDDE